MATTMRPRLVKIHFPGEPLHVANPAVLCFPLSGLLIGLAQPHL
jgi:hypothetical protein